MITLSVNKESLTIKEGRGEVIYLTFEEVVRLKNEIPHLLNQICQARKARLMQELCVTQQQIEEVEALLPQAVPVDPFI